MADTEQWDDPEDVNTEIEVDLEAEVEAELAAEDEDSGEPAAEDEDSGEPAGYGSNVVAMAGREFEIDEPRIEVIVEILKALGRLAVRGEQAALRQLQSVARNVTPSNRAVIFGMLAAFSVEDLVFLGTAVLQFKDFKEGRKWLRSIKLELAPLIRAFFLNLSQSRDLRDSIQDFFTGLGMADGFLEGLNV